MEQSAGQGTKRRAAPGGRTIALGGGAAVLLIFMFQNTENVHFQFLLVHFTWPLWLYTIIVSAFGGLVWFGFGVFRRHRRRMARREERP